MKNAAWLIAAVLFAAVAATSSAADPSGKEIVAKSNDAQEAEASVHKIEMTLVNKRGEKLVRRMVSRSKSIDGLTRSVTTFLYPEETKGTKFLLVENAKRDDDMRIFIPDLGRVRTISSTQRRQSYMGTDFAYGDLEALDPDVGVHKLSGTETIDGQDCYIVETMPDAAAGSDYAKIVNWFRKDNFIPVKTEYYDKDGALKKIRRVENVYQQGKTWIMKTMTMEDVQKDHRTVIDIVESKQSDFPDEYFTERFLTQTDRY